MSWSLRRVVLTLGPVTCLYAATFITQAVGQGQLKQPAFQPARPPRGGPVPTQPPAPPPKDPTEFSHAIDLPKDKRASDKVEAAQDYIDKEEWATACEILQDLLQLDRDYFMKVIRKGAGGKETVAWVSVKSEADRLLNLLPKAGLDFYKLTYGPKANEALKEAKTTSSAEQLTIIMRHYLHTDAGAEATNLLATYLLDRGEWTAAALCYEKLLNRKDNDNLSPVTLFKAAYAFRMVSDKEHEEAVWTKLRNRGRDVTFPTKEPRSIEELQQYVAKVGRPASETALFDDTHLLGGNPSHSAQARQGGAPFMVPEWKKNTWRTSDTKGFLDEAMKSLQDKGQPLLPAAQPITATITKDGQKLPLVIFRSTYGVHAFDARTGALKWEQASLCGLDRMLRSAKQVSAVTNWLKGPNGYGHLHLRPNILFENSTVGTLSTDGTFVFAVEDLPVPPAGTYPGVYDPSGRGQPHYGDETVNDMVAASKLQAFNLSTGKMIWDVGGKAKDDQDKKDELKDSYFLGAPMPLGGKLFVLVEKQQDLRLASLDPLTGKLLSIQTLATAKDKMAADAWRRVQATHLAYGEGILVCPTNAGALLGVDLLSGSLVWAYPYRGKDEVEERWDPRRGIPPGWVIDPNTGMPYNPNSTLNTKWKVSPPVIVDGKVVFTAPDADQIHCVNLKDGSAVWTQKRRAEDLYLAGVFSGKAVIVGKGYARAVSLAKGENLWEVPTGMPSGYGVASDNVYYLPLKETPKGQGPEICAIDIEKGVAKAHTRSRKKGGEDTVIVPGNLLFYDGWLLSQTATEIAAFPQLEAQIAKSTEALKKNPKDPEGLYIRGQLRLDKGDLAGAIDDLRGSLKNQPGPDLTPKVREKLYDSLTEFFQRDFNEAEKFLAEYEEMCKIEGASADAAKQKEQRRRRANFLCLVAKGKEAQGKLVEAFERYQQFAAEATDLEGQEPIPTIDEPTVKARPDVWSGGRIAAMVAKAKPEDRKPLEDLITKKWQELKKTEDLDEVRNFVRVFGSLFAVGKEARLELANRLMDDSSPTALLEAEQHLSLLRVPGEDAALAGRAVETLARLNTRKGLLEDASYFYRLLRDQYAKVPVRDGKTGGELFNDMATDKRLLPHLDVPSQFGITGKQIKVDEQRGNFQPTNQQLYEFGQSGEPLPFFQSHKFGLRLDGTHQLKITDRLTGDEKSRNLTRTNFQNLVYTGRQDQPKYRYMTMGHLVVLPLAHMVFGIDPVRGEVLWERNLYGDKQPTNPGQPPMWNQNMITIDPRDNSVVLPYQDGWVQRIGGPGTLEGSALCLHTRDGLIAIDPVTGKTLWTRTGVSSRAQLFNDDQHIYVVEMDGNKAASTRVLRAYDGVSVDVPDFAQQYQKRIRQVGRNLLLSEADGKGQLSYRMYDVLTGKDVWTASYAANSVVLKSEDPNFGGVVEPDGTVHVTDIRNGKEAMKAKMDPQFLAKVDAVHLLSDGRYFFVACHGPIDPAQNAGGTVWTNLVPNTGMRALPVNGEVYCFDAQTGKMKWHYSLLNQMIVLEHFNEMPVLLATSRYNKFVQGRGQMQVVTLESITKSNGKYVFKGENQQWPQFHTIHLDPKKGTIELVGYTTKFVHTVSNEAPPDKK